MSEILGAIAAGTKPFIGMIQLRPLAGSSRYHDGTLEDVRGDALAQAELLRAAGFTSLMVQNLGDLPVAGHVNAAQIAWMTCIACAIRHESGLPVGLNFLENDAEAMLAVASAADLDFIRVKVFVGAMITAGGIEAGQAFAAIRARTAWRASSVAIFADVHDRTAVPLASASFADDVRSAVALGGADGLVLTGRSHAQTLELLKIARATVPDCPLLVGGGVSENTVADIVPLADGAIVSSALKAGGDLFGQLDARRAAAFIAATITCSSRRRP